MNAAAKRGLRVLWVMFKDSANGEIIADSVLETKFKAFIEDAAFPCLGARAALSADTFTVSVFEELGCISCAAKLAPELEKFVQSERRQRNPFATFVAIFREPRRLSEKGFERLLWSQLQQLHRVDAERHGWDPAVASDPLDPRFSFSFAGQALYVVGLHAQSSRVARRFPYPTLVFNPHEQFERLRNEGKWKRMQSTIRSRDLDLQGSINPMLSDFGERSEARQYSGREVGAHWKAPFQARPSRESGGSRCPFGH